MQKTEINSFRGGIHPPYNKELTNAVPVRKAKEPAVVTIPMSLHIGAPCKPVVKKGDTVYMGQMVGEATGFVSSPVFASVSGTVKAVEERPHPNGNNVLSVVIESDGKDTVDPAIQPYKPYTEYSSKEIIDIIRDAGIVGMGGATFPTHVKLTVSPDKHVDTVILNGAECEPYLTADDHLMQDHPDRVVKGLQIAMRALNVSKGVIAIETNKPQAIEAVAKGLDGRQGDTINKETIVNAASVQMQLDMSGKKVLLTGDCTPAAISEDIDLSEYQYIQLPHHGKFMHAEVIFERVGINYHNMFLVSDNTGDSNGGSDELMKHRKGHRIQNTKTDGDIKIEIYGCSNSVQGYIPPLITGRTLGI